MTPYEINLLLHFYTTPSRWEYDDLAIFDETVQKFIRDGLIERCESKSGFRTTKLGEAMCLALQLVPLPRAVFVDQNGNILERK